MNKSARLNLIKNICAKRNIGPKLLGLIAPSKEDTREEISLAVNPEDKAQSLSAPMESGNDDFAPVNSALSFDSGKVKGEKERDSILSANERKQVKAELTQYRIRRDLSAPRNPFALVLVS